jgi:uncharacterized protein
LTERYNATPCHPEGGFAAWVRVRKIGLGVYVTVLAAAFANTEVLEKFGFDPKTMPMKPLSVGQCVSEGLNALRVNRSRIIPGRLNRIMNALVPASFARKMEADMIGKGLASKSASAKAQT